jgi:hypothetical protein
MAEFTSSFLKGQTMRSQWPHFSSAYLNYLDCDFPDWRDTHFLLLDNCPNHKTKIMRKVLARVDFKVMFSAPASYLAHPVERIFAFITSREGSKNHEIDQQVKDNY